MVDQQQDGVVAGEAFIEMGRVHGKGFLGGLGRGYRRGGGGTGTERGHSNCGVGLVQKLATVHLWLLSPAH